MGENITRDELLSGDKDNISQYVVVGGHFTFSEIYPILGNEFRYFAVMRDPVERVISTHNYIMRLPDHPLHNKISEMSMLDAIRKVVEFRREVSNFQCCYLSENRTSSGMHAMRSIIKNGIKVYTLENYSGMIEEIARSLELPSGIDIFSANIAPAGSYDRDEYADPALLETIRKINKEDIWLYNSIAEM